VVSVFDVLEYI